MRRNAGEQVLITRPLPEPVILAIETSRVCSVLPPIIAEAGNSLQVRVVTYHAPDLRPAGKSSLSKIEHDLGRTPTARRTGSVFPVTETRPAGDASRAAMRRQAGVTAGSMFGC